ncbi:MAG: sigma-54 dependent transcriptional regulator [Gammaproteobacteria bacterium]|nr:sigma-54 dependent transcriptional regulator [Gammaproteobacteria bacterium]MCW8911129.1 sigma-54 dependent transcriptional regulator [Gammaproteobacteria bacterium]MCW9004927.1 sigma-54 dependent transcriptional regulator [Gammaproteobacteria bacterium]MCW9056323.1 sigma-54 dependent transcriptional regulator [Gammaproteobacteria bacterium]
MNKLEPELNWSAREGHDKPIVLVVEDDKNMRELIARVLGDSSMKFEVVSVENAHYAMDYIESTPVAVVVTDLKMPGASGLDLLNFTSALDPTIQVVMVTGHATVESAVAALKQGSFDYLRKPFDNVELLCTIERALMQYHLSNENQQLRERQRQFSETGSLVGASQSIEKVSKLIDAAAAYDCSVMITGESGSGKELVARQIQQQSNRKDQTFVAINCAAIPENLIESELFGYRKGAFTGADRAKTGLFEEANNGTLFLDEINNAPLTLQAKLLRVLQDGSFYPMGETTPVSVDVRVIAASNRNIAELIEKGEFREDLYYRLMVMEIAIPPLRERRDDIPLLAYYFLNKHCSRLNKPIRGIQTEVLGAMIRYDWPGNVRELENLIQRMIIMTESDKIGVDSLPQSLSGDQLTPMKALDYISPQSLEEIEAYFIRKTLRECKNDRALAASILGIDKSTLWRKIKRYNLDES